MTQKKMYETIEKLLDVADTIKVSLNKRGLQWNGKEIVNIEPKFKVGDWIIFDENHNSVYQIERIDNYRYYLRHYLGGTMSVHFDNQLIRHWTIQDAKDGDVLEFGDHGRLVVGIVSYVNKTTGKVDVNCLLENNNFKVGNYYNLDTIKPHPATKEQREQLEKAIADAEYVWLSGKKLKKIEELTKLENESKSILLDKTINWDEIRIQAAIAAMKGMLANATLVDDARLDYRITIEQAAVSYANTLVEELKKKG